MACGRNTKRELYLLCAKKGLRNRSSTSMIFGDICNRYPISYYLRLFIRHPLRAVFIERAVSILSVTISDFNQVRV